MNILTLSLTTLFALVAAKQYNSTFKSTLTESNQTESLLNYTEKSLFEFASELKTFVNDIEFDDKRFFEEKQVLEYKLLEIRENLQGLWEHNEVKSQLISYFEYAANLFQVMTHALQVLQALGSQGEAYTYVKKVVQINVTLLALPVRKLSAYDEVQEYSNEITTYSQILSRWHTEFYGLDGISKNVRTMFDWQFDQANKTLSLLKEDFSDSL